MQYAGATKIAKEKILANMQTRVGRPYDERTVEDDIRNLYAPGTSRTCEFWRTAGGRGARYRGGASEAQISEVILNGVTQINQTAFGRKSLPTG